MTPLLMLAVATAGGVGSALRYLVDAVVPAKHDLPWSTLLVNITGSAAIGAVSGAATVWLSEPWAVVLSVGLLGGYTTLSSASLDTARLLLERRAWAGVLTGIVQLLVSVVLAFLGFALAVL